MEFGFLPFATVAGMWLLAAAGANSARAQSPSPAASPTPDPLAPVESALRDEREAIRQKAEEAAASSRYAADNFDSSHRYLLEQARQQLLRGEDDSALNTLAQIRAAAAGDKLVKACDTLIEQLRKTRAERESALESEADTLFKRAGDEVLRATQPKDLDATLHELTRLSGSRIRHSSSDDNVGRILNHLQTAISFVNRWQDYLFSLGRGDETAAANILRGLADSTSTYSQFPIVPRSEILARLPTSRSLDSNTTTPRTRPASEFNAAVAAILDETRTLDDLPAAVRKLSDLRKEAASDSNSDLGAALNGLQAMQKARLEIQSGMAVTIDLSVGRGESSQHPAVENKIIPLRAELIRLALPRLLNLPDEKPAANEGTNAFLRRLIDAARQRADWVTVQRGLDLSHAIALAQGTSFADDTRESEAFKGFLSGLNLETAGQYEPAVIAFFGALKSGTPSMPSALIGEHLDAIQKAHPKEFADGKSYVLNPPAQQFPGGYNGPFGPNGPNGARGGFDPRTGQFRPPGMPEPPTPTVVQVPAASPTPIPPP